MYYSGYILENKNCLNKYCNYSNTRHVSGGSSYMDIPQSCCKVKLAGQCCLNPDGIKSVLRYKYITVNMAWVYTKSFNTQVRKMNIK